MTWDGELLEALVLARVLVWMPPRLALRARVMGLVVAPVEGCALLFVLGLVVVELIPVALWGCWGRCEDFL